MNQLLTDRKPSHPFPGLTRRILTCTAESMLVEHTMETGSIFPLHQHRHEQTVYVITGTLHVETHNGDVVETRIARAGDSWVVPGNVPHRVTALEAARVLDFFTPFREDFLD